MATGNIKGGKRNYAKPTTLSTSVMSASTTVTGVDIVIPSTQIGAGASSYLVTGTSNDGGAAVSTSVTGSTTSATGFTGGKNYSVTIAGRNYNGLGDASGTVAILIPEQYELRQTFTADGTLTIPDGSTKLAGIVVSTGGTGGTGANTGNSSGAPGGGGGGSGAIAAFWEFAVTAGQTATVTIGSSTTASKVTYGGTDIATANAGAVGGTSNTYSTASAGGAGGTASSNISNTRLLVNGYDGASSALGYNNHGGTIPVPNAGLPSTETINFSTTSFNFSPNSTVSIYLAGGGGGGTGAYNANGGTTEGGAGSAGGAVRGGTGGTGGRTRNGDSGQTGNAGNAANAIGSGGGGGGGRPGSIYSGGSAANGGAGGAATIYLYTR